MTQLQSNATLLTMLRAVGAECVRFLDRTAFAVFDNPYVDVSPGDATAEGSTPQIEIRTCDVAGVSSGTTFEIRGDQYRVFSRQDDGTGLTIILFEAL